MPRSAARNAAAYPPGPPPITARFRLELLDIRGQILLADFHPDDQATRHEIDVLHRPVEEYGPTHVANYLVNIYDDAAIFFGSELQRSDIGIKHAPLARPVGANAIATVYPTALHAVRPLYVRMHQRENRIYIAPVECVIDEDQQIAFCGEGLGRMRHPCTESKNGCSKASAIQRRKRAASAPSISR